MLLRAGLSVYQYVSSPWGSTWLILMQAWCGHLAHNICSVSSGSVFEGTNANLISQLYDICCDHRCGPNSIFGSHGDLVSKSVHPEDRCLRTLAKSFRYGRCHISNCLCHVSRQRRRRQSPLGFFDYIDLPCGYISKDFQITSRHEPT